MILAVCICASCEDHRRFNCWITSLPKSNDVIHPCVDVTLKVKPAGLSFAHIIDREWGSVNKAHT